jgi:chromosome segregation ATPase
VDRKEAYIKRLEAQFEEWRAEIDLLKAKANTAQADARIEYEKEIEELEEKQAQAKDRLEGLRAAGENSWGDLRKGLDQAWDELRDAVSQAAGRFEDE